MSDELDTNAETVVQEDVETEVRPVELSPFVQVGDESIEIKRLTARKVATISNIFGEWLLKGHRKLNEFGYPSNDMAFIVGVLTALDEDSLVKLAATLIERDNEFAREYFDLSWVLSAVAIQMQVSNLRAVIQNFTSLLSQIQ